MFFVRIVVAALLVFIATTGITGVRAEAAEKHKSRICGSRLTACLFAGTLLASGCGASSIVPESENRPGRHTPSLEAIAPPVPVRAPAPVAPIVRRVREADLRAGGLERALDDSRTRGSYYAGLDNVPARDARIALQTAVQAQPNDNEAIGVALGRVRDLIARSDTRLSSEPNLSWSQPERHAIDSRLVLLHELSTTPQAVRESYSTRFSAAAAVLRRRIDQANTVQDRVCQYEIEMPSFLMTTEASAVLQFLASQYFERGELGALGRILRIARTWLHSDEFATFAVYQNRVDEFLALPDFVRNFAPGGETIQPATLLRPLAQVEQAALALVTDRNFLEFQPKSVRFVSDLFAVSESTYGVLSFERENGYRRLFLAQLSQEKGDLLQMVPLGEASYFAFQFEAAYVAGRIYLLSNAGTVFVVQPLKSVPDDVLTNTRALIHTWTYPSWSDERFAPFVYRANAHEIPRVDSILFDRFNVHVSPLDSASLLVLDPLESEEETVLRRRFLDSASNERLWTSVLSRNFQLRGLPEWPMARFPSEVLAPGRFPTQAEAHHYVGRAFGPEATAELQELKEDYYFMSRLASFGGERMRDSTEKMARFYEMLDGDPGGWIGFALTLEADLEQLNLEMQTLLVEFQRRFQKYFSRTNERLVKEMYLYRQEFHVRILAFVEVVAALSRSRLGANFELEQSANKIREELDKDFKMLDEVCRNEWDADLRGNLDRLSRRYRAVTRFRSMDFGNILPLLSTTGGIGSDIPGSAEAATDPLRFMNNLGKSGYEGHLNMASSRRVFVPTTSPRKVDFWLLIEGGETGGVFEMLLLENYQSFGGQSFGMRYRADPIDGSEENFLFEGRMVLGGRAFVLKGPAQLESGGIPGLCSDEHLSISGTVYDAVTGAAVGSFRMTETN